MKFLWCLNIREVLSPVPYRNRLLLSVLVALSVIPSRFLARCSFFPRRYINNTAKKSSLTLWRLTLIYVRSLTLYWGNGRESLGSTPLYMRCPLPLYLPILLSQPHTLLSTEMLSMITFTKNKNPDLVYIVHICGIQQYGVGHRLHQSSDTRNRNSISGKRNRLSFLSIASKTGPEAQPSSCSTDTAGTFPGGKGLESRNWSLTSNYCLD